MRHGERSRGAFDLRRCRLPPLIREGAGSGAQTDLRLRKM